MLKRKYDKKENIPEGLEKLYSEKDGSFNLKPIEGLKPIEEFQEVQREIDTLKKEKSSIEKKYKALDGLDLDGKTILTKLDQLEELETKKKDIEDDPEAVKRLVDIKTKELQREIDTLKKEHDATLTERDSLKSERLKNLRNEQIRKYTYDQEKAANRVYDAVIPDIQEKAERDFEYIDATGEFVTKDDKKLKMSDWLELNGKERLWFKGSRGDHDAGGTAGSKTTNTDGSTLAAMEDAWGKIK